MPAMSRNAATRPYGSARGAVTNFTPAAVRRESGVEVVHLEEEPGARTGVLARADGQRPIMTAWT